MQFSQLLLKFSLSTASTPAIFDLVILRTQEAISGQNQQAIIPNVRWKWNLNRSGILVIATELNGKEREKEKKGREIEKELEREGEREGKLIDFIDY